MTLGRRLRFDLVASSSEVCYRTTAQVSSTGSGRTPFPEWPIRAAD